jgi:sigma-E factor negative regulatory protein RseB
MLTSPVDGRLWCALEAGLLKAGHPQVSLRWLLRSWQMLCGGFAAAVAALACVTTTPTAWAADVAPDPLHMLARIQEAARQLDYAGVFVYSQGSFTQSSQVVHMVDGTGTRERLEVLDGEPLEFIRHNDEVRSLMPQRKKILLERRRTDHFPGLLVGNPTGLSDNYQVAIAPGTRRVAGRTCHLIVIEPLDNRRYGYQLCADVDTGLLLKAQTLAGDRSVIEQVMFSSIKVGGGIPAESLSPSWSTQGWTQVESIMTPVDLAGQGWRVPQPVGFLPVMQLERVMSDSNKVSQIVFSDGLAAISVFIEPYDTRGAAQKKYGPAKHGAINVFGTRIANFWLTAMGEVPVGTLKDLAESTEYVPLPE